MQACMQGARACVCMCKWREHIHNSVSSAIVLPSSEEPLVSMAFGVSAICSCPDVLLSTSRNSVKMVPSYRKDI